MKLRVLNRKVHSWTAIVIAVPIAVIVSTGILLQLKKYVAWVQPPEQRGRATEPGVAFADILSACQRVPEAQVQSWADIHRVDVRPSRGMLKVTAKNNWEIQLDAQTGDVLQVAYRRSDIIESLHDGSWFHDQARLWIFLPTGAGLLVLWCTGMYLFWLPRWVRWRRIRS